MKIILSDTYEAMSHQAADDVMRLMDSFKDPVLCTASGDTPKGLYKELVDKVSKHELDTTDWRFVGLDEWMGINEKDEGSCFYHLNRDLFQPLQVQRDKICFFDGRTKDPEKECERVENYITDHHGIDIAILGLGMNGHAGMNEPGTSIDIRSHIADIDPLTQQVGQKYFTKQQELKQGLTLGLGTLMEARHIFLLVSGRHKAEIVQKILEEEISEQLPASLFRRHPGFMVYLDADAASNLVNS